MKHRAHSPNPQDIDKRTWYYEENAGLFVIHEIRDGEKYIRTDQFIIPWRMVLASVKRHELRDKRNE